MQDVRFRGSYQRAVRAANIVELFTAQGFNLFDMNGDPCGAADRNPNASDAECIASGVPAAYYDGVNDAIEQGTLDSPAGQYQFLQGGNLDLAPEESDTYSYGIVLTPRFAPGLAVTIDYFDIKIDDTISTFGAVNTLNACYDNSDAAACSRILRNPGNGSLWLAQGNVVDTNINIGSLETKGYRPERDYTGLEIGRFGSLTFNLTGTYLDELITEPGPGIDPYDCVGFYSSVCGTPTAEWRHLFRTSWQTPWDLDLSLTWRLLRRDRGSHVGQQPVARQPHRPQAGRGELLRPVRQLGGHGEGVRHPGHQQRPGRQPVRQRQRRHDRQRQHLPADLRRPRSLRLPRAKVGF